MSKTVYAEILQTGRAQAFPTNQQQLIMLNLDGGIAANWGIEQAWFDNGLVRKDTMLLHGYNFVGESREDPTEPAWGFQLESYDVAADLVTPLLAAHLTLITTGDVVIRPWSCSVVRATNLSDLNFQNRNFVVGSMNNTLLAHAALNGPNVGVGVGVIANANNNGLHVKGDTLWENPAGSADDKYWQWTYVGDRLVFRAVNDAFGAANDALYFDRAAAVPTIMYVLPKIGIGGGGDAFLYRGATIGVNLDGDSVGTYNKTLRLLAIDVQGANGAGLGAGTIATAPHAGNPDAWIPQYWQGTLGWVPWWHA